MKRLKEPKEYLDDFVRVKKQYRFIKAIKIERHINRHPTTDGRDWGWYEIFPLGISVGEWTQYGYEDLTSEEIDAWNEEAKKECELIIALT